MPDRTPEPDEHRLGKQVQKDNQGEAEGHGYTADTSSDKRSDVVLDVPNLKVEEINLEVEDLRARVSLRAEVLDLLRLSVGADVALGRVSLGIKGVEAEALLKVRLQNVARILDRVMTTIDENPEILQNLTRGLGSALEEVGEGAGGAVKEVGRGAGGAVEEVGRGAGGAVKEVGRGAGGAVEEVGRGAGKAAEDVGEGAGRAVEGVGQGAGEAVEDSGEAVSDAGREGGKALTGAAETPQGRPEPAARTDQAANRPSKGTSRQDRGRRPRAE